MFTVKQFFLFTLMFLTISDLFAPSVRRLPAGVRGDEGGEEMSHAADIMTPRNTRVKYVGSNYRLNEAVINHFPSLRSLYRQIDACAHQPTREWLSTFLEQATPSSLLDRLKGPGIKFINLSPDKTKLAVLFFDLSSKWLQIWDVPSGELKHNWEVTFKDNEETLPASGFANFSSDGRYIVAPSCCSSCVQVWEVETGKVICRLGDNHFGCVEAWVRKRFKSSKSSASEYLRARPSCYKVRLARFAPDGKTVFTYSPFNGIQWWDFHSKEYWNRPYGPYCRGYWATFHDIHFSQDRKSLCFVSDHINSDGSVDFCWAVWELVPRL